MSFRSERKWAEITIFLTNNSISKIKFSINGKGDQNRIEGELMRWIIEQVSTKKNVQITFLIQTQLMQNMQMTINILGWIKD